jgi:prepilin-type N-terminal cleavage/methylation domain-containing protein
MRFAVSPIAKYRGFTLLELVFVIILLGIIGAISSKILSQGLTSYLTAENLTNANWQSRLALERMVRDLHEIRSPADITTATAATIVFNDMTGTAITYQLTGSTLMRNTQVLADGISSFTLSYFDQSGTTTAVTTLIRYITINLSITLNNTNNTFITSVNPRNLP